MKDPRIEMVKKGNKGKSNIFGMLVAEKIGDVMYVTNTGWAVKLDAGKWEELGFPAGTDRYMDAKGNVKVGDDVSVRGVDRFFVPRAHDSVEITPTKIMVDNEGFDIVLWKGERGVVALHRAYSDLLQGFKKNPDKYSVVATGDESKPVHVYEGDECIAVVMGVRLSDYQRNEIRTIL